MNTWGEYQIGLVYFASLFISVLSIVACLIYLHPVKPVVKLLVKKFRTFMDASFRTTVFLAGILGAFSVSFRSCSGRYDYLLASKRETFVKGAELVSTSYKYLWIILGFWLIAMILIVLFKRPSKPVEN